MEEKVPSVILLDDYALFRKGMADVLTASKKFEVIGQTSDATVAMGLAGLGADLLIMSIQPEEVDTLAFLKGLKEHYPNIKVVMLLNDIHQTSLLIEAIRLDANGYLLRTVTAPEFVTEIEKMCFGGMAASDKLTSALAEKLRVDNSAKDNTRDRSTLTRRESEVLACLASGMNNKDISEYLEISDGTVKVHVKHVLKKLKFRSRVEVAVWASEQGYKIES